MLINCKPLILAALLCCFSCDKPTKDLPKTHEITPEERVWMTDFFKHVMLWDHAIYTLWGSKPLTLVVIDHYTDEEIDAWMATLSEEELKECSFLEINTEENWAKWEQIASRFPLKNYLFFKSTEKTDPHVSYVYFVDILKTAHVIEENYDLFRSVMGFDFHPLEVVLEIPDPDSLFWTVFREEDTAHLWGLLFGFGRKNALAFHWKHFDHPETCEDFCKILQCKVSDNWEPGEVILSLETLTTPAFMSFQDPDDVVERYKKERDEIRKKYKGKDFLDATLERLIR